MRTNKKFSSETFSSGTICFLLGGENLPEILKTARQTRQEILVDERSRSHLWFESVIFFDDDWKDNIFDVLHPRRTES